jgi:hypothetical protein
VAEWKGGGEGVRVMSVCTDLAAMSREIMRMMLVTQTLLLLLVIKRL